MRHADAGTDRAAIALFLLGATAPRRLPRRRVRTLVAAAGGAAELLAVARGETLGPALTPREREALGDAADDRFHAAALEAFLGRDDARMLFPGDDDFPPLLAASSDPPLVLFGRSRATAPIGALALPVAIVGSRRSTHYGTEVAKRFSRDLALSGVAIVSGMARGIDGAAHRACLDAGGTTLAVLGSGVDVDYPRENAALAADIVAGDGWVLSEYPPGTRPDPARFPERNRIIASLSRGVLVVEAADRSGSLITARLALEEGREVWGVPGSVFSENSSGVHRLIRDGARLVASAADLLADLPPALLAPLVAAAGLVPAPPPEPSGDPTHRWLVDALSVDDPRGAGELAETTGRTLPEVLAALVESELEGFARAIPGGRWVRTAKRL